MKPPPRDGPVVSDGSRAPCLCGLCGEGRREAFALYFDGKVKLHRCRTCGFVSQLPGSPARIESYADYYNLAFAKQGQRFMYPRRRAVLADIRDRVLGVCPEGRLLDVGCGDGHFLHLCRRPELFCVGVEESPVLAGYAAEQSGATVVTGRYEKGMFDKGRFDVVTLIQVLEHVPWPREVLATARYHLRRGGLLVVEVPSIRSPHYLAWRLTGIRWFVRPPNGIVSCHIGYYTPRTLERLAREAGFRKLSLVTGRWRCKYTGLLRAAGYVLDPLLNAFRVGGICYLGVRA